MRRSLALVLAAAFTWLSCAGPALAADVSPTVSIVSTAAASASTPAVAATASPSPVFGDLSHLEGTATGDLHIELIDPLDNGAALGTSTTVEVVTGLGQVPELRVNGETIAYTHVGRRTVDKAKARIDYIYYGVPLLAGPNRLELRALGAHDASSPVTHAVVYGPGSPATLRAHLEGKPVADGTTALTLHVEAFDQWGHPAAAGSSLSLSLASGDVQLFTVSTGDGPRNPTGRSSLELVLARGGSGAARVLPGLKPGDVDIHIASHDVAIDTKFFLAPYVRPPLVSGLVSGGVGAVPAVPGDPAGVPDGTDSRRGRVALYGTGAVGGGALATVAYDSAATLQSSTTSGAFVDDPNARPYVTSGDASVRRDDALSRDHLYLRIDLGRSSVTWGEFQAETGPPSGLGGFDLLVQGAKLQLTGNATKLSAFSASNDVAYGREVIAPTGLATLGATLHPDIVVGSDVLTLVALDRRTGAILTQTTLLRNQDYTLDYGTGMLRFITIPLPFDEHLNPQQILVQYEYSAAGSTSATHGARLENAFGHGDGAIHAGVGYVSDDSGQGSGALTLFSQDLRGGLNGGDWSFSHLTTSGAFPMDSSGSGLLNLATSSGNAYRAELTDAHAGDRLSLLFEATSSGYNDPFGGLSTPGLLDERVQYEHDIDQQHDRLELIFDHVQNSGATGTSGQSDATLQLKHRLGARVTVGASLSGISTDASTTTALAPSGSPTTAPTPQPVGTGTPDSLTPVTGTTLAGDLNAEYKPTKRLTLALDRQVDIAGPEQSDSPAQTSAQLSYAMPGNGTAYIRQLWSDAPTSSFAAATQELTVPVLGTRATTFGFERPAGNATFSTDYSIEHTANGNDIASAFGVRDKLNLGKYVHGDAFFQHGSSVGAEGAGFDVYGLTLAYSGPGGRMRANGSYQERTGNGSGETLLLGAAGALSPVVSLLGTINSSRGNGVGSDDERVGFAFRPAADDKSVSLLDYQQIDDTTSTLPSHGATVSFEQLERPTTTLELAGRYAYKLDGDTYYAAHSSLLGLRATQRVGARNDVAVEMSRLLLAGIGGVATNGFAVESGYRIADRFRLAAGYSFSGSADPALTAAPTRRGIYFTATSVVDSIFGWGRRP